jgi:hypothetical protein
VAGFRRPAIPSGQAALNYDEILGTSCAAGTALFAETGRIRPFRNLDRATVSS